MNARLCQLGSLLFVLTSRPFISAVSGTQDNSFRFDVFGEILREQKTEDSRSLQWMNYMTILHIFIERLQCDGRSSQWSSCDRALCINRSQLAVSVGGREDDTLTEEQFAQVCVILVHYVTKLDELCYSDVVVNSSTLEIAHSSLTDIVRQDSQLKLLWNSLEDYIQPQDNSNPYGRSIDDGDDDKVTQQRVSGPPTSSSSLSYLVIKKRCLSADALLYYSQRDEIDDEFNKDSINSLSMLVVYLVFAGAKIEPTCRLLPYRNGFINHIFSMYASNKDTMSLADLKKLMLDLGIQQPQKKTEGHLSVYTEERELRDGVIERGRAKRSQELSKSRLMPNMRDRHASLSPPLGNGKTGRNTNGRSDPHETWKRSGVPRLSSPATPTGEGGANSSKSGHFRHCLTAEQLAALYQCENGVDQEGFKLLCPGLISMLLHDSCPLEPETKAQLRHIQWSSVRLAYGLLAVTLNCMSAVLDVFFIPCMRLHKTRFSNVINLFLGLAVGSLLSVAVLHLLPAAMANPAPEDYDSNATDEAKGLFVEEYTAYGMIAIAGVYIFFLIESLVVRVGGHTHELPRLRAQWDRPMTQEADLIDTILDMKGGHSPLLCKGTLVRRKKVLRSGLETQRLSEPKVNKSLTDHDDEKPRPISFQDKPFLVKHNFTPTDRLMCGVLRPIAVAVLLGDTIINFANGMAIGAAFNDSLSAGFATSFALFCHVVPNELGDFAVIMQTGLSLRLAVMSNMLCSLSAVIGLYAGVSVEQQGIAHRIMLAGSAGLFIYVTLADLLPRFVVARSPKRFAMNNAGMMLGFLTMFLFSASQRKLSLVSRPERTGQLQLKLANDVFRTPD